MLCAAFNLLAQNTAQRRWKSDHQTLSDDFKARQLARLMSLQVILDECYVIIGVQPARAPVTLRALSAQLEWLSKPRGLEEAKQWDLIEKSEQIESICDENQAEYLAEIKYLPKAA